MKPIEW